MAEVINERSPLSLLDHLPDVLDPWEGAQELQLQDGHVTLSQIESLLSPQDLERIQAYLAKEEYGEDDYYRASLQENMLLVWADGDRVKVWVEVVLFDAPGDKNNPSFRVHSLPAYRLPDDALLLHKPQQYTGEMIQERGGVVRLDLDDQGAVGMDTLSGLRILIDRHSRTEYGDCRWQCPIAIVDEDGRVVDFGDLTLRSLDEENLRFKVTTRPVNHPDQIDKQPTHQNCALLLMDQPGRLHELYERAMGSVSQTESSDSEEPEEALPGHEDTQDRMGEALDGMKA